MKKRILWVDAIKGLAILLVVAGHNTYVMQNIGGGVWFNRIIGVFDMPLFFMCSGYTFRIKEPKMQIVRSFRRLLLPYFITSGLLILNNIFLCDFKYSKSEYILSWICGYGYHINNHLLNFGAMWFLTALFWSIVLFDSLVFYMKKDRQIIICSMVISACGYLIGTRISLPMNVDIGMYAIIFVCIGYLLKKMDFFSRIDKKKIIILFFSLVFYILGVYEYSFDMNTRLYDHIIIATLGAIGGSILFFCFWKTVYRNNMICNFLKFCGENSLIILCLHILEHTIIPWNHIPILFNHYFLLIAFKIFMLIMGVFVIRKISVLCDICRIKNNL